MLVCLFLLDVWLFGLNCCMGVFVCFDCLLFIDVNLIVDLLICTV